MAVYHLDIEEDYYNFELLGISSHEKDYRLAWAMNKKLNWQLERKEDIVLTQKYAESRHARFTYTHPVEQTIITLIDNKTEDGLLMPELQQFDYVLKIDEAYNAFDDAFYRKLRTIPFVIAVHALDLSKLRSKQNLIYENR